MNVEVNVPKGWLLGTVGLFVLPLVGLLSYLFYVNYSWLNSFLGFADECKYNNLVVSMFEKSAFATLYFTFYFV